jgi:dolichol-phosphate mannosyltransferase
MRLISIVIPVYNEEANVRRAYDAVCGVFETLSDRYRLEIIFADNHSTDRTFERLAGIAQDDERVKVLRYNRNYGFQRSLMTAYRHASGDAAIQLDCDLQDPPGLFPEFIRLWEQGHDMVVGLRRNRRESRLMSASRWLYYRVLNAISEDKLTPNAGDFRLVDRSILEQLRMIDDHSPYVRGILSSLARSEAGIVYDREARLHGKSNFPVRRLVGFALSGIFGHSTLPLRMVAYIGLAMSVITFMVSFAYLIGALLFGRDWPSGFATTTILILLGIGLNGIFLGVIGEYVGRIYQQVRVRPTVVVERSINMQLEDASP